MSGFWDELALPSHIFGSRDLTPLLRLASARHCGKAPILGISS
jgi:hypothetical protein